MSSAIPEWWRLRVVAAPRVTRKGDIGRAVVDPHRRGQGSGTPPRRDAMSDGKGDQIKGRVKEAAGSLTDDDELKTEGKVDRKSGEVKEKVSDTVDKVKDKLTGD
jgi:uncharacterized protein YjbJ (UPF0337 family)